MFCFGGFRGKFDATSRGVFEPFAPHSRDRKSTTKVIVHRLCDNLAVENPFLLDMSRNRSNIQFTWSALIRDRSRSGTGKITQQVSTKTTSKSPQSKAPKKKEIQINSARVSSLICHDCFFVPFALRRFNCFDLNAATPTPQCSFPIYWFLVWWNVWFIIAGCVSGRGSSLTLKSTISTCCFNFRFSASPLTNTA